MVKKLAALLLIVVGMVVSYQGRVVLAAGEPQFCKENSACIVGEFLFDDNYVPINVGATCTLLSRDPNGGVFVNSQLMSPSGQNDGWYSYNINVGVTEGIYPTQMCCTVPEGVGETQYMCLDKSFRVAQGALGTTEVANAVWNAKTSDHNTAGSFGANNQNPTLTAASIWGYTNRTLSDFGTLVSQIWSYSDKSLTTFGNLVADVWNSTTRTLTAATLTTGKLATQSDVIGVQTSLATATSDIRADIANVKSVVDSINSKVDSINTKVDTLISKWGSYSASDLVTNVTALQTNLGGTSDTCSNNTVFGNIACVKDKWGSQTAESLYTAANGALNIGTSLRNELTYNGKTTTAYQDLQTISNYVDTLEASIGNNTDLASGASLFAKIKGNQESVVGVQTSLATATNNINNNIADVKTVVDSINTKVDSLGTSISDLSNKWGSYSANDILIGVNSIKLGLGASSDSCSTASVFGNIACVKDKWGSQTADALYTSANNAYNTTVAMRSELNYAGKSTNAYDDLQTIKSYVDTLENSIGNSGDLSNAGTLFAKIKGNNETIVLTAGEIKTVVDSINTKVDTIGSTMATLVAKWGSYSASDIISNVNTVQTRLGTTSDTCSNNTIFGNIACIKDKWGSQTAQSLYDAANNAYSTATALRSEINYNGKSTTAYEDAQTIKNYVDSLESSIGSNSDLAAAGTLFGKIKGNKDDVAAVKTVVDSIETKVNSLNTKTDGIGTNVGTLLSKWGSYTVADVLTNIGSIGTSLGTGSDTCANNTVFGNIACVKDKWGSQTAQSLYTAANNAFTTVTSLRAELDYNGKSSTAYSDLQSIKNYVDTLETSIGNSSDLVSAGTIFGKIKGTKDDVAGVSSQIAGVQTSVDSINSKVDLLSSGMTTLNGNVNTLLSKWSTYSVNDVLNSISSIHNSIGVSGDVCGSTTTIFGGIACLQNNSVGVSGVSGGDNSVLLGAINNVSGLVSELTSELNYNGKSTNAYNDVQAIKSNLGVMLTAMGNSNDDANTATVFGRMKKIQSTVEALNNTSGQAATIIDKWGSLSASDIYDKVKNLSSQISAINLVPDVSSILKVNQSSASDLQALKNQVFGIRALIDVNQTLLEKTTVKPIIKTWLEEGSIIFKTMITNPGTTRQTVPLKFYLPREADKKNVIKIDAGLDVAYDSEESAYYVTGEFDLNPNETRVVAIEVEDVWKIPQSKLDSLKLQTEELAGTLKNSAYFAQGVTIKSDVLVALENIGRTQKEAVTPDSRIKTYRDNAAQLKQVVTEISDLKGLVTQSGSSNNLMGFVGGSQTVSSWAIIIVLIVGIVFLTNYMKSVMKHKNGVVSKKIKINIPKIKITINTKVLKLAMMMLMTVVPTFWGTWMILDKVAGKKIPLKQEMKTEKKETPKPTITTVPTPTEKAEVLGVKTEKIKIGIPEGSTSIKVRIMPDSDGVILARIWSARDVDKYSEKDEWIEIGTNLEINGKRQFIRGWIRKVCQIE